MREIKFRVWDKVIGEMYYDIDLSSKLKLPEVFEVMQFTGLLDKNGNEIYEGDIMKVRQRTIGKGKQTKYKDFNISVEFYNGAFVLPFKDYGEYRFRDGGEFEHSEVIGNIYENPELLNKNP